MPGLDENAYLAAYRASVEPRSDAGTRNRAALEARLASSPRRAAPRTTSRVAFYALAATALAALTLATASLIVALQANETKPSPSTAAPYATSPPPSTTPATAIPKPDPRPSLELEPEPEPEPEPAEAAHAPAKTDPNRRPHPNAPPPDALRRELALMRQASDALDRADYRALDRLTRQHRRRFPDGAMTHERRAWQAIADCRLRRAPAPAARFLADNQGSPQAGRVAATCPEAIKNRQNEATDPPAPRD